MRLTVARSGPTKKAFDLRVSHRSGPKVSLPGIAQGYIIRKGNAWIGVESQRREAKVGLSAVESWRAEKFRQLNSAILE